MDAPNIKNRRTALERIDKFLSEVYFVDVNLAGKLYSHRQEIDNIYYYSPADRISYEDALKGDWRQVTPGQKFGPTWSTHWFRLRFIIPELWLNQEVRLRWNSGCEAMVWKDGNPVQGLSGGAGKRTDFILSTCLKSDELSHELYIEMACNDLFGAGDGLISPPNPDRTYAIRVAEIVVFDREACHLIRDLEILYGMANKLSEDDCRGYKALYLANEMIIVCDTSNPATFKLARDLGTKFFGSRNGDLQHVVHAMGHCHIDTAWLWPISETKRKCARSWSSVVKLMEQYDDFTFTCSQAQQLSWIKKEYPSLYEKIKHFISLGKFIPVGGTWVEMDGNIPSGESFIRQFVYGQRFFEKEFGKKCDVFWLPDTFGYSAQLPQIIRLAGIECFLTQKISWNLVNTFPHNSFIWHGIDGSDVYVHFPSGDSYNMEAKVEDVLKCAQNNKDKGRFDSSVMLYGYGDGGGGPTEEMIQRSLRMEDVDGLPKVKISTPSLFFDELKKHSKSLCTWVGELYLELHQGTYTTQAKLKQLNRQCESLLQELEFSYAMAALTTDRWRDVVADKNVRFANDFPAFLWETLLLHQFHDILPGSSIHVVHEKALSALQGLRECLNSMADVATSFLMPSNKGSTNQVAVVNSLCWPRTEVSKVSPTKLPGSFSCPEQVSSDNESKFLLLSDIPSMGIKSIASLAGGTTATGLPKESHAVIRQDGDIFIMRNDKLTASFDSRGRLLSVRVCDLEKEFVASGCLANQFVLFDDVPLFWDAWDVMDYHLQTRKEVTNFRLNTKIAESGPLRVTLHTSLQISGEASSVSGGSYIEQWISLDALSPYIRFSTEVRWTEAHKFLKVEFPFNIQTNVATYDIQFGHLHRPNHLNTSWDSAKYEVCGHKWMAVTEYGNGVAILNDCKYGYSALGGTIRMSLLRSPKSPDPYSDMGEHSFDYAVMPFKGSFQSAGVIQQAYNFNSPLRIQLTQDVFHNCFVKVDNPAIIVETVKQADAVGTIELDSSTIPLVMRIYESFGGTANATVSLFESLKHRIQITKAVESNIYEEVTEGSAVYQTEDINTFRIQLTPFQVKTVLVYLHFDQIPTRILTEFWKCPQAFAPSGDN